MRVVDCEQNTPLWHATRAGKCTGSRIADVTAKGKNGAPSAMRATYLGELVAERLSGSQPMDGFMSAAMKWGRDQEEVACASYAIMYDAEPTKVGFVLHPTLDDAGASPDRIVGERGCMQVKCPNTICQIDWLLGGSIEGKYIKQMQWEMLCAEREWCDFVGFDPRLPPELQLYVKRIPRDDKMIADLEREVKIFLNDVSETVEKLRKLYLPQEIAA